LGARFQTRLNQSRNVWTSARRAGFPRIVRRLGPPLLEITEDRRRVGKRPRAVEEHRHERLAAQLFDDPAVVIRHLDPLGAEALEGERERDALAVRRDGVETMRRVAASTETRYGSPMLERRGAKVRTGVG
jgi:hypothetical protein